MTASPTQQPRSDGQDQTDRHQLSRIAVVFNPTKVDQDALTKAVTDAAGERTTDVAWYETSVEDAGKAVTAQALEAGASLVLVAGGDGTVRAAAEAMRGSGVPLALIPSGTGNLLARNLGMPLGNLAAAIAIAFGDGARNIDVGVAEITPLSGETTTSAFMVMAGLGLDAAIMANTSATLKKAVGWLAYVDAGVRSLPKMTKLVIRYAIDPAPERTAHISTILIGNCGSLPGNIELLPEAKIDDGLLDIAVLQPKTLLGWLAIWRKVTWENRVLRRTSFGRSFIKFTGSEKTRTITYLRGEGIRLAMDEPQPFELDGDEAGEVIAAHLWADAGALIVKVA